MKKFNKFYRDIKIKTDNKSALNNDVNKVKHSAYAHLLLKSKETNQRLSSSKGEMKSNELLIKQLVYSVNNQVAVMLKFILRLSQLLTRSLYLLD